MGRLYDLIQAHIDAQPYGVSERQLASKLGVTQTTLKNWRTPKKLVDKEHLVSISRVTGVPYLRVLDALLDDIGYLREEGEGNAERAPSIGTQDGVSELRRRVANSDLADLPSVAKKRKPRGNGE